MTSSAASRAPRPQTAIFDFDGTIVDSLDVTIDVYNQLAPGFRIKPIDRTQLQRLRTLGPKAAMREHDVAWWKLPLIVRSMRAALHEHVDTLQAIPDMLETLHTLSARGCRLGILSTNSSRNIERFLARHDLHIFEHVAGGSSMLGKARALRRLMRSARLDAASVFYVGDEVRDVQAANASGVRSVAVSWGYAERATLAAHAPTHMVDHPRQLIELVAPHAST